MTCTTFISSCNKSTSCRCRITIKCVSTYIFFVRISCRYAYSNTIACYIAEFQISNLCKFRAAIGNGNVRGSKRTYLFEQIKFSILISYWGCVIPPVFIVINCQIHCSTGITLKLPSVIRTCCDSPFDILVRSRYSNVCTCWCGTS